MKTAVSGAGPKVMLSDLVDPPEHGWESCKIGPFLRYRWTQTGPPRWKVGTGIYKTGKGMARAFLGPEPCAPVQVVDGALAEIAAFMEGIGIKVPPVDTIKVLLWDPAFPLPPVEEAGGCESLQCPVTFIDPPSYLIVLPTRCPGKHGRAIKDWLRSSAIHEGLHGILWSWLAIAHPPGDLVRGFWTKFEEMCAVALEYKLAGRGTAWLDFGRAWQGTLALSHYRNDWPGLTHGEAWHGDVHKEDYGHFPLLAWMDEVVWSARRRKRHWLAQVWDAVRNRGWGEDPWQMLDQVLQKDGGLKDVFRRYVVEAAFPSSNAHVLDRIRKAFGAPPAAWIRAGDPARQFVMGWMAVQYLRCDAIRGKRHVMRIVDGLRRGAEVQAFWVNEKKGSPQHQQITRLSSFTNGKASIWEISLERCPSGMNSLLVIVCQPDHNGSSVVFTAEVT